MCEKCIQKFDGEPPIGSSVLTAAPEKENLETSKEYRKRRPKLWELELDLHCSIIGTCAPVSTLRKIYERVNKTSSKQMNDYEIHNLFVQSAEMPHVGIKMLHKYLEKTHAKAVSDAKSARNESELKDLWRQFVREGDIAGGYWAVFTHQCVTQELGIQVFGEMHMMSHISGREWQAEKVQRKKFQKESTQTKKRLSDKEQTLSSLRKKVSVLEIEREEMRLQVSGLESLNKEYESQISALSSSKTLKAAENKIKELEKMQHNFEAAAQAKLEAIANESSSELDQMGRKLDDSQNQISELESQLAQLLIDRGSRELSDGGGEDLCGRCVLYVGGQTGSQSCFRQLVETRNGKFLYHDGGREDSRQRLAGLLTKADAVICPASCVSHSAAYKIKKICSKQEKKMIWLRSASLAAFNSALQEINQVNH